jgi:hypothetical protein
MAGRRGAGRFEWAGEWGRKGNSFAELGGRWVRCLTRQTVRGERRCLAPSPAQVLHVGSAAGISFGEKMGGNGCQKSSGHQAKGEGSVPSPLA